MKMRSVYIGLGANLGDRESSINAAISAIESELVENRAFKSLKISNIYETKPWGMDEGTPKFLNCVVCLETSIDLESLLDLLLKVETDLGRTRSESEGYQSRVIDCDILCAGEEIINTEKLVVPHPHLASRQFVLKPLADLEPNLIVPGLNHTVKELLK